MKFSELSFSDAPVIKTQPPGPKSLEYLKFQSAHEGNAVSYPRGMPMALRRAKGATVEDVDGNIYIDFFSGAGVMNFGHSNPAIIEAAATQLSELTHALDFTNPAKKVLVEKLLSLLPNELGKLFFGGPTGSDAVEAAMKLARFNTRRVPMVSFEGAYHGMSAGALSLTSGDTFREDFLPVLPEIHFVPYPYCYRCAFGLQADSCGLQCAEYLDHVLESPHSGIAKPAAVIFEAVQGEGGSIVPPEEFARRLRDICDRREVLLIVDEIQAGFCRTGSTFAFQHSGIVPDIVTFSKALGGAGFPISCIAYKDGLDKWPPGKHIGTFRGNVVAYAAGAAAIKFMVENGLADYTKTLGLSMLAQLAEVERESSTIGEVRGKGLMFGVELVRDKESKDPAPELAREVRALCHRRGLLTEVGGHYFNVLRFLPPLVVTEGLAKKGLEIFAGSLLEAEKSI